MSTTMENTAKANVDLADLFSVTISSKQLEIVLSSILSRLGDLEKDSTASKPTATENSSGNDQANWGDAIERLQRDLETEKQRGEAQQELLNNLKEANDRLNNELQQAQEGIQNLTAKVADIEERKADKVSHVDPLAEEIAKLKKDLANNSNNINAVAARAATLEGLTAAADPEGAKDKGLTSFTDTLNDVLNKQRELEDAIGNKSDADQAAAKELADLKGRLAEQEEKQKEAEKAHIKSVNDFATHRDLEALAKDLLARIPTNTTHENNNAIDREKGQQGTLTDTDRELLDSVQADIANLKKALRDLDGKQGSSTVINNSSTNASPNADLEERVAALEQEAVVTRKDLTDHQAATKSALDNLSKELVDTNDSLQNAVKEIKALGQECSKNTADCQLLHDRKADKSDLLAVQEASSGDSNANNSGVNLGGLQKLLDALDGRVSGLAQDKAGKDAVNQLIKDMADLKNALKSLQSNMSNNANGSASDRAAAGVNGNNGSNNEQLEKDVKELQRRLDELDNWTKGQLIEIRATVDHIHHSKADAAIVANKAERDYVENAMEKLMHEVETVLNATNAGLIDTLDKSLNILRDMIDGKATKQDVNKLQGIVQQNNAGDANGVPDGLAGYKTYRCLGCNRTMETMRPRPMGSTMNSFTSRVPPASGRNAPASSQGPRPNHPLPIQPSQPSTVAAIAPPPPKNTA